MKTQTTQTETHTLTGEFLANLGTTACTFGIFLLILL